MTTFRNDDVGETLRRLDELHMHGPHRGDVLVDYRIKRASALGNVPAQTANETQIVGRVDEDLYVHLLEQAGLRKDQNAFDDYDRLRLDAGRGGQPRVRFEIIDWQFDRLPGIQLLQMIDQQFVVDRVRVIEVRRVTIVERHVFQITIVKILLDEDDFIRAHRFQNAIRYRRLA